MRLQSYWYRQAILFQLEMQLRSMEAARAGQLDGKGFKEACNTIKGQMAKIRSGVTRAEDVKQNWEDLKIFKRME